MNQLCVYCQSSLAPGERVCPQCGRWQPPRTPAHYPANDPFDDAWEDADATWASTGGQGFSSRGAPSGARWPAHPSAAHSGQPRRRTLTLKILIVVLALAVVGLGGGAIAAALAQSAHDPSGKQAVASGGPTATAAPGSPTATTAAGTPTDTPTPGGQTPTPGAKGDLCTSSGGPSLSFKSKPDVPLLYDRLLPDNLPIEPQERDTLQQGDPVQVRTMISPAVYINVPPAGQTIIVCKMTLRLVAFTPVTDPGPNVLDVCSGVYMDPGGYQGAGCGGGFSADGVATFDLTSTQVGATLVSSVNYDANTPARINTTSEGGGVIRADIRVSTPGTYTFSFGLWQDTSGPIFDAQTLSIMILVSHLHYYWGGTECLNETEQSQMPTPTDTPIAFVCPGPAPL